MFSADTYSSRRKRLAEQVGSGLILIPGNSESPMNYPGNPYHFRQDSTFLYFFGHDVPGLAGVVDADSGRSTLYGDDFTVDDIIWMGPQQTMAEKQDLCGADSVRPFEALDTHVKEAEAQGRTIHFLPQYRGEGRILISRLTGHQVLEVNNKTSETLIRAVVAQRNIKSPDEVAEIEKALEISYEMNRLAMKSAKAGLKEQEIYGAVEGLVLSRGSHVSFPVIFSVHGETLHNHHHHNIMKDGDLLVLDSGAESPLHYASDITRTFPVNGKFTPAQADIYSIVLEAQLASITRMRPGETNRNAHLHAVSVIASGLKDLGFMKGDVDEAVAAGAHALFMPHGLGHMIGLDVHDMENLGEDYVGYDERVKRGTQFGLAYLRMGRAYEPGHVLTTEPGIYFIPELIDQWAGEKRHAGFINYEKVRQYRDFGGIRIEDDVLITETEPRVLGRPIAKTIDDVVSWCAA
ncbi:aminopeptidase P family protein [bacterium]|nr:aminopeptidase P family protein [bacterium]